MSASLQKRIHQAQAEGRRVLIHDELEVLAKLYGIPVPKSAIAQTEDEAKSIFRQLGFPVVMKLISGKIAHKTEVGGVKLNLCTNSDIDVSFRELKQKVTSTGEPFRGALIQKMAPRAHEFVVGGLRDPTFGPAVMFGLGGMYVELLREVTFCLAPVGQSDALQMIKEARCFPLFSGFRGEQPLDTHTTAGIITKVGQIMLDNEQIDSVEINPLFVYSDGVQAADIRVVVRGASRN